jgi:hypothetical protein
MLRSPERRPTSLPRRPTASASKDLPVRAGVRGDGVTRKSRMNKKAKGE